MYGVNQHHLVEIYDTKIIHYCWFGGNEKPELIKNVLKVGKLIVLTTK